MYYVILKSAILCGKEEYARLTPGHCTKKKKKNDNSNLKFLEKSIQMYRQINILYIYYYYFPLGNNDKSKNDSECM